MQLISSPTGRVRAVLLVSVILLSGVRTQAQLEDGFSIPDLQSLKTELKTPARLPDARSSVPMDAPLDPQEYRVGPGDQIGVNIWSSAPIGYQLTVTPEGTLLIPSVGSVDVNNLTLAQVKEKVARLTARRFLNAEASVTLIVPRKVTVEILGAVVAEGKYDMNAVQRVDRLIAFSNVVSAERMDFAKYASEVARLRNEVSERRIMVKRRTGEVRRVDLARYRATGRSIFNPYLQEGDVVYVPSHTDMDYDIAAFGCTMNNAQFEYVQGDSLSTLIGMALGFPAKADPEHAVLTRLSPDGSRMDSVHVDARAVVEQRVPDIALRPGDRLMVPVTISGASNFRVSVNGEVNRPGIYPVTRNTTRVSDAIRMAGGVTSLANLRAAVLYRSRVSPLNLPEEIQQEILFSRRATLGVEDSNYYGTETALRLKGEIVPVDFRKLLVEGDSTQDITLQMYDRIEIPPNRHTVYVFGQVLTPGHITHVSGKGYKYYIEKAGGFTNESESSDVKIIKAATRTWLDPDETTIDDGDLIWVPREVMYPLSHYLTMYAQVAAILGTIVTIGILLNTTR